MSLLDRGNADILLYPEIAVTDADGNTRTKASDTPIPLRVQLQPVGQSGTAARRAEQDNEGYESEVVMRMRLLRKDSHIEIGAQSKVLYEGEIWSVFGDPRRFFNSPRTTHWDYSLRRA